MAFIGQARVIKTGDTPVGPVTVQGQPGFELRVTVTQHPPPPTQEPVNEESWFSQHTREFVAIGAIFLVIAAVALAPETGGSSLLLLSGV